MFFSFLALMACEPIPNDSANPDADTGMDDTDTGIDDTGADTSDTGADTSDTGIPFTDEGKATEVVDAPGHTGGGFGNSGNATNGVAGGGATSGGFDVFSLGYREGVDNYLVLAWGGKRWIDGPGVDLVVFENPFHTSNGTFMDLVVVEVSEDGENWTAFPHDYTAPDETTYSTDAAHWQGFAGATPVLLHEGTNRVNPFDQAVAGGDGFDLADISLDGFSYVRLTTAPTVINPDTNAPFVHDSVSNGADIDGVYARYGEQ